MVFNLNLHMYVYIYVYFPPAPFMEMQEFKVFKVCVRHKVYEIGALPLS